MEPLVSVVIATHNQKPEYLDAAVQSAIRQTHKNLEILVVDDGSDPQVIGAWDDPRVAIHYKHNGGLSSALNYGLRHMRGEYFKPLDSDDILEPTAIARLVQACQDSAIAHMDCASLYPDGRQVTNVNYMPNYIDNFRQATLFMSNYVSLANVGIMYHKSVFNLHGIFDESIRVCEDYEMKVRLSLKGYMFRHVSGEPNLYRRHDGQISKDRQWIDRTREQILRRTLQNMEPKLRATYEEALQQLRYKVAYNTGIWHCVNIWKDNPSIFRRAYRILRIVKTYRTNSAFKKGYVHAYENPTDPGVWLARIHPLMRYRLLGCM